MIGTASPQPRCQGHQTTRRRLTSTWKLWRRHRTARREHCRTACTTWSGMVRCACRWEVMELREKQLTSDLCLTDDLPRMGRGGAVGVARNPMEQSEGLMELDQVDSRGRRWRRFCISGHEYHVNMSVLEPYLQVLSHGGQRSHTHQTTCNTPAGASHTHLKNTCNTNKMPH